MGSNSGNFLSSGGFSAPGPGVCLLVGFFDSSGDFRRSAVFRICAAVPRFGARAGADDGCDADSDNDNDGC
jgi:hypothetical protein